MSLSSHSRVLTAIILSAAAGMVACSESTGPGEAGQLQLLLAEGGESVDPQFTFVTNGGEASAVLTLDAISSIHLVLEAVEALPSEGQEVEPGAWISLAVEGDGSVELLELGSEGIVVARGSAPAGGYHNVRLRFSVATITLTQTVALPSGLELEPGTYDLRIPGGAQTGLKVTGASFTVSDGASETLILEVDTAASVQTVVWNPQGLMMTPVLTPRSAD